uniref:Uncharacterized protein n=1 Tax=Solanum lycopersicum TaxID=4081 RepID=K4D143_SOLLC
MDSKLSRYGKDPGLGGIHTSVAGRAGHIVTQVQDHKAETVRTGVLSAKDSVSRLEDIFDSTGSRTYT